MAPLVSCTPSPMYGTAGKQCGPIGAWPYQPATNRAHARRAKMNGFLLLRLLTRSHSPIPLIFLHRTLMCSHSLSLHLSLFRLLSFLLPCTNLFAPHHSNALSCLLSCRHHWHRCCYSCWWHTVWRCWLL